MKIDVSFQSIMARYFRKLQIDILVIPLDEWDDEYMKDPVSTVLIKGFRMTDVTHILPVYVEPTGFLQLKEPHILTVGKVEIPDEPRKVISISDEAKGVLFVHRIIDEEKREHYTYKSVEKVSRGDVLSLKGD